MDAARIRTLLEQVRQGELTPEAGVNALRDLPFEELGFAKVDHHRALRQGFPEVIFCLGKTSEQIAAIAQSIHHRGSTVLATRATPADYDAVRAIIPEAIYHTEGRVIVVAGQDPPALRGSVGVICAGTGDVPVAEEAACTLEAMGASVIRIYDVGVAGLHRLLHYRGEMQQCAALIAVAGMEGAMPSVIGGLVDIPVIAVPTSVGYGAAFGGLAALLGMLNSCANGVAVVNIDNGFGAAAFAATILNSNLGAAQRDGAAAPA